QLQVFHYEYPAERGRGVKGETKVKPTCPQRLLARAGKLEEVVTQHADRAERNRDEHRDRPCSHVEILSLKESAEERRRFTRDADDFVRCLTIEFEIELGFGSTVVPVGKKFEFASPQPPLCERGAFDGDAHTRRLPGDPAFPCNRFGRGDDAARDETRAAFVLAREDENRISFGDVLATIHRLVRAERERLRPRITNLGFDREHPHFHFAPLMSWPCVCGRV